MARLGLFATIFLPPYTAAPRFEPTSVELHQTGPFEVSSTDWATAPRRGDIILANPFSKSKLSWLHPWFQFVVVVVVLSLLQFVFQSIFKRQKIFSISLNYLFGKLVDVHPVLKGQAEVSLGVERGQVLADLLAFVWKKTVLWRNLRFCISIEKKGDSLVGRLLILTKS